MSVLIVEKDPVINHAAVVAIEDAGFTVLHASNAKQALELIHNNREITVLFTSFDLGGLLDGRLLAYAARIRHPDIRIILATGADPEDIGDLPEGCTLLSKPYTEVAAVSAVTRIKKEPTTPQEPAGTLADSLAFSLRSLYADHTRSHQGQDGGPKGLLRELPGDPHDPLEQAPDSPPGGEGRGATLQDEV